MSNQHFYPCSIHLHKKGLFAKWIIWRQFSLLPVAEPIISKVHNCIYSCFLRMLNVRTENYILVHGSFIRLQNHLRAAFTYCVGGFLRWSSMSHSCWWYLYFWCGCVFHTINRIWQRTLDIYVYEVKTKCITQTKFHYIKFPLSFPVLVYS